jgi:aryl-alcohol dehydrogenase-like predicted oxidoreductase
MQENFLTKAKDLGNLAQQLGISMAQLSIAWCIKNPNVTTAILGATNKDQLLQNLKSLDAVEKLDNAVMQKIDDITETKPVLPEY